MAHILSLVNVINIQMISYELRLLIIDQINPIILDFLIIMQSIGLLVRSIPMAVFLRHHKSIFPTKETSIIRVLYLRRHTAHVRFRNALWIYWNPILTQLDSIMLTILRFSLLNTCEFLDWAVKVFFLTRWLVWIVS
jgi:hypothetical protein